MNLNMIKNIIIIKKEDEQSVIDTFLMSCRIIGRNIEYKFASEVFNGIDSRYLKSEYLETGKNSQVKDLYEKLGFKLLKDSGNKKAYLLSIDQYSFSDKYNYIKVNNG